KDSVSVSFNGRWATGALWNGFAYYYLANRFLRADANNPDQAWYWTGRGNGKLVWTRGSPTLVPGTYVDTLHVQGPWWYFDVPASGHQKEYLIVDTLVVTAAPVT